MKHGDLAPGEPPPSLVDLDDPRATEPSVCGAKAATLAVLRSGGFRVPDGVVLVAGVEPTAEELAAALARLGGAVAVRSSTQAEDGADASWAGQLQSTLDVRSVEGVVAAIAACRASARSERARAYAAAHGDPGEVAVLIQRMVPADRAGVAFSADPVTGAEDEVLVSAIRGLGDQLVRGEVVADEWRVGPSGPVARATPQDAIDADEIGRVAALAREVASARGAPQDIEWASAGGELFLLQARPIVDLPLEPERVIPEGSWTKDAAHFPDPITPLGTAYLQLGPPALASMFEAWGLMPETMEIRFIGHEAYSQVGPPGGPTLPWWLVAVVARVLPSMRRKLARAAEVIATGQLEATTAAWEEHVRADLAGEIAALRAVALPTLRGPALVAHLDACMALAERAQVEHFRLFVPYLVGVYRLHLVCRKHLGWDEVESMTLLSGLSKSSSAPSRALRFIAERLSQRPGARAVIERASHDVLEELAEVDPEGASALDGWIDRWGFGCVGFDPGRATLAEQPRRLAELLRDLLDAARPVDAESARQRAIAGARTRLAGGARAAFDAALARAEIVYPLREENLVYTDALPGGLIRRAALEVGRRLVDAGCLRRAEDVAYLRLAELRAFAAPPSDLADRVTRRRRELRWARANPGPPSYGPALPPPPDVRGLPGPARLLNGAVLWAMESEMRPPPTFVAGDVLRGIGASAGTYRGRVRVVRSVDELHLLRPGEVLACPITTPSWSVYFSRAGALVTDSGSVLSHAAVIAREHGVPAVVATGCATRELTDGVEVVVDGRRGTVERIGRRA